MNKFDVEKKHEGKHYIAIARVDNEMLTVSSIMFGSKSAKVSSNNEVLASILLQELIDDHTREDK